MQAAALERADGVAAVTPDELHSVDTASTPTFLGLDAPGGLWEQLGGTGAKKAAGAGEGVVIGIVDSGIWPESKSFSDRDANGKLVFQQLPGWNGKCVPGEAFNASLCGQGPRLRRCRVEGGGRSSSSGSSGRRRCSPPPTATSAPRSTTRSA